MLEEMQEIVGRHATVVQGSQATAVPRLSLFRAERPSTPTPGVYQPMLCIVVAGRKRGIIRKQTLEYVAGDALLVTVDLPVVGTVLEATPEKPYLALCLDLHRPTLASVVLESKPLATPGVDDVQGVVVERAGPQLLDAALRLVRLLDRPRDITALAPLVEREILYRLLTGPWGATLADLSRAGSTISQISRAVAWLQKNYVRDYDAATLAEVAAMSISSLNRHFRAVTAMSPLEYQKRIRLQEARSLLLAESVGVAEVGYAVGYRSASQFTREYRRLFDEPPGRSAERLRREGPSVR